MSGSENQPGVESAQEADVHDPLTSTLLDDIDTVEADKLLTDSSTNLIETQPNVLVDDVAHEDIAIESVVPTHDTEIDYANMSPYDDQPWAEDSDDLVYTEDMPSISLTGPSPYEHKTEEQPRTITDPTHSEGFVNAKDHPEATELAVSGELPGWLQGEHFTIGPGTYDIKFTRKIEVDGQLESATSVFTFGHWFDSLPLVNRFDLNGNTNSITYRSRLTSKRLIEKIRDRHGYAPPHPAGLFKTDTNQTVLVKFLKSASKASKPDYEPCASSISTCIPGVEGKLFAQNHANHLQELDPFDLKPTRVVCWNEINPAFKGYSASPNAQYDTVTGEWINYTMEVGFQSTRYHFFSLSDRDPKGTLIASVVASTSYVHSFAITPRYIILVVFPFTAQMAGVKYAWNESILDSFTFQNTEPTLFYVISRESQQHIATYRADACFAFNHVNAFEDDNGGINLDIVCYSDDTIAHQLTTANLRDPKSMDPPHLAKHEIRRFYLANIEEESMSFFSNNAVSSVSSTIGDRASSVWSFIKGRVSKPREADIESDSVSSGSGATIPKAAEEIVLPIPLELPQVNASVKGRVYNFVWGLSVAPTGDSNTEGKMWNCIVKANLNNKEIVGTWSQPYCYPSEAGFIPRPARGPDDLVDEDDGILVSIVLDAQRATSFLLILDANTMQAICRADLPYLVPLSFARSHITTLK
ncbi:retinal pigment epithelial membrane protein-domain-containing protein [Umbelopsis sp. PMI_123]|nr:retinal pigment epithelial membrane protein-domain-containing protein [Umbelopsis sp. PMI_123]